MTNGERMVWTATYAASWTQQRTFTQKYGLAADDIGAIAADEAWGALEALREIANSDRGDFKEEARAVLFGEHP